MALRKLISPEEKKMDRILKKLLLKIKNIIIWMIIPIE